MERKKLESSKESTVEQRILVNIVLEWSVDDAGLYEQDANHRPKYSSELRNIISAVNQLKRKNFQLRSHEEL